MSIQGFMDKINSHSKRGNFTLIYLLIIVFVGFSSFFLGRLSTTVEENDTKVSISSEVKDIRTFKSNTPEINSKNIKAEAPVIGQGKYVASKNGKLYYTVNCKGANRIKEENRVWFDTAEDAQKSGYTWATSCK